MPGRFFKRPLTRRIDILPEGGRPISHPSNTSGDLHQTARELANQAVPEGWQLLASSHSTRVACHAGEGIYYKEFISGSPLRQLLQGLRGNRARKAWRNNEALRLSGFTAPENLARGKLGRGHEYLFTRAVPGDSISHWLRHGLGGRDSASLALRRNLLRELGTFIGRLHATGFVHGDLRPQHVLASFKGGQFRFGLIDNGGNRLRRPPPGKGILKNLVQLNLLLPSDLTRSDRWRCFLNWRQQHPELGHLEARLLARESYRIALRQLPNRNSG